MKRHSPLFAVLATAVSAPADATSTLAMCAALEARMAAGDGATLPDAAREFARLADFESHAESAENAELSGGASSGEQVWTTIELNPYTDPGCPSATALGAVYLVAGLHTHPPTFHWPMYVRFRKTGPSGKDFDAATNQQVPGIVFDYVPSNPVRGTIRRGHQLDADKRFHLTTPPIRRPTP